MLKPIFHRYLSCSVHICLLELVKAIKLQAMIGSKIAFFSFSHCFGPLIGLWGSVQSTLIVYALRTVIRLSTYGLGALGSVYHIPSFCGALYLSTQSKLIRMSIPLLCLMLFSIHPVGNQVVSHTVYWLLFCVAIFLCTRVKSIPRAVPLLCFMLFAAHPTLISELFSHSFYWTIPILIALINPRSIFLQALGSTFTAHAVGSVIWLYCYTLTPEIWHSLVALIWLERIIFALGMTLVYYTVAHVKQIIMSVHASVQSHYLPYARRSS